MTYTVLTEFVNEMAKKLDMNMHKQHWRLSSLGYLRKRLHDEVKELMNALDKEESPNRISSECADIANFAMMISDYYSDWYADITTAQLNEKKVEFDDEEVSECPKCISLTHTTKAGKCTKCGRKKVES